MVSDQEQKVKAASNSFQIATDRLNTEMEGGSNSKIKGFGRIAKEKKEQVGEEKTKLTEAEGELKYIKAGLTQAKNPLSAQASTSMGLNTILNRVKLLHEFVNQNILAFWAWFILLMIGVLLEVFGVLTKCFYPKSAYEEDQDAIRLMMDNKRKMLLEQSMYYTSIGVHGREALNKMETRNQSLLN
jgi:hypothetical protein